MRDLKNVLIGDGLNLAGWQLTDATGISADDLTIAGNGIDPSGESEAWVARFDAPVPEPSTLVIWLCRASAAIACKLKHCVPACASPKSSSERGVRSRRSKIAVDRRGLQAIRCAHKDHRPKHSLLGVHRLRAAAVLGRRNGEPPDDGQYERGTCVESTWLDVSEGCFNKHRNSSDARPRLNTKIK